MKASTSCLRTPRPNLVAGYGTTARARWLLLLLLGLPAVTHAQDFTYTINNGTITITKYTGPGGAVTIPSKINGLSVTSIGAAAFWGNTNMTSITIPESVTNIGDDAFFACASLSGSITIPNSVIGIGSGVFQDCARVASITIGTNVPYISDTAFAYCTSLTSVTIPNSVTNIGQFAFLHCLSITNANLGSSLITISYGAFMRCSGLTSVAIPGTATSIGGAAFGDCGSLTNISIGASVTNIGDSAFQSCSGLTSVTIPRSVTKIGGGAFYRCENLTGAYFRGNAPVSGGGAFNTSGSLTVYYLPGTTGWEIRFDGRPTALWLLPEPLILESSVGTRTNGFGYLISWATNVSVAVETCTNLANPTWSSVATNTLTDGWYYFSDPEWTNYPARFYRIRSP